MIPQRYEVSNWNEWDGVSLKPAEDGDLLLYADAEKWIKEEVEKWAGDRKEWMDKAMALARKNCDLQKEIVVLTAQRDKATKDVEDLIRERRALLDERETLTAENIRLKVIL